MFDFRQIVESTDNFCNENKLGQGGFGAVYKVICYAIMSTLSVVYIYMAAKIINPDLHFKKILK